MILQATSPQNVEIADGSAAGAARALSSRWLGGAIVLVSLAVQLVSPENGDNAWLFTVAEKILDGARPYIDIIESNPPGAVMIYAPAVLLARLLHIRVEYAAIASVFACAGASIWLTGRVLRQAGLIPRRQSGFLFNAALFALLFAPGFAFGEREHIASLLVLPILAVYAARASDARVGVAEAMIAGLAAALATTIKPHFALAVLGPLLFVLARRRSLSILFAPEQMAGLAGSLANLALLWIAFPAYFPLAAILIDVYAPMREPLRYLLLEPHFPLNVGLLAALILCFRRELSSPLIAIPALASVGFVATYLIQSKGWLNHGYPGVALALLAIAMALAPLLFAESGDTRLVHWARLRQWVLFLLLPLALDAPLAFGLINILKGEEIYPGLTAAVLRHAPPHPTIIAVSPRLDVGHPLTRVVGGEWVGRPNALWVMMFSRTFIDLGWGDDAYRARLKDDIAADARGFREDVERNHPDIVLVVENDRRIDKAMQNPDVAAAMSGYARVDGVEDVGVWTRRSQ